MGYSKRDYTTTEERRQAVLDRGNPKSMNKITAYLSQENVKAFNSIVTDRMLSKMRESINGKGRPKLFKNREECQEDIENYFKLCIEYNVLPTVASFCVYCGANKDTIYTHINDTASDFSDLLKNAVDTILAFQEGGALANEVASVPFIFLSKNYFGMKDNQDVVISTNDNRPNNIKTIEAIKEQIDYEDNQKLLQ